MATLEISVGDSRCPAGSPVAILDGDGRMLSCFSAVSDAIHARQILERGRIGYQTTDCPDPDDPLDPATDPEDCCDGDPDGEYHRQFVVGGVL